MPPAEAPHVPAPTSKIPPESLPVTAPPSRLKGGLKAGGKAIAVMLLFAGLEYLVHRELEKQLQSSIDTSRDHMYSWGTHFQIDHPGPVYFRVVVRSEEYTRYIPLLGWMPESPRLYLASVGVTSTAVDPPVVTVDDHSFDLLRPGKSTEITYTELLVP